VIVLMFDFSLLWWSVVWLCVLIIQRFSAGGFSNTPHTQQIIQHFRYLLFAILVDRLLLVQSLQGTVVTLVELPGFLDGNPHELGLLQNMPKSANGALQETGKSDIGLDAFLGNQLARLNDLFVAFGGERTVVPSGEFVFQIPSGFSVTDEHQCVLVCRLNGSETGLMIDT